MKKPNALWEAANATMPGIRSRSWKNKQLKDAKSSKAPSKENDLVKEADGDGAKRSASIRALEPSSLLEIASNW